MGQQIHIGGFKASADLAERAQIGAGEQGVDLCCCNGAGMRFLVRFDHRARQRAMWGRGNERTDPLRSWRRVCHRTAGRRRRLRLGEDAWCYVFDKARLISEAVRIVKPGGTIAFTDWISGAVPMTAEESDRFLRFMSFPNVQDVEGYRGLLEGAGCTVMTAEDTSILDFNADALGAIGAEMQFMRELAHACKIAQGRFIAQK